MDVGEVLRRARAEAGLDQRGLARAAGTARTTVVAYESGAQSPTVRQLSRLLAACGYQARVVLEPLTAAADDELARALASGPPEVLESVASVAASLDDGGVRWALDGRSAVAAQGLGLPHEDLEIAFVDEPATRAWLRARWAKGWDRHGFSFAPSWYEDADAVPAFVRRPVYTAVGFLQLRFDDLGERELVHCEVGGRSVPALSLPEVRRAHPPLEDLLRRHDERLGRQPERGRTV